MVPIKTKEEIEIIKEGAKKLASIMNVLEKNVFSGVDTLSLDKIAESMIVDLGGESSFRGYGSESGNPFPSTICASINDEIVHGIPSKNTILNEGDIFKVDIGMKFGGFHTDMARTFAVGKISPKRKNIIEVAKKSFYEGVGVMKNGKRLSDYSRAVQEYVEKNNFSVVRDLVGHGVGRKLHEEPQIPNYFSNRFRDLQLKSGMVFALEPMINYGGYDIIIGEDGWVFKTEDGSDSAHWENTVLITNEGVDVLTEY